MRKLIAVAAGGLAVLLVATLVVGSVASAQDGDGPVGSFIERLAQKLGISEEQLTTAIRDTNIELIDEAVADGRIAAEKGEELKARVESGEALFPFAQRHGGPRGCHGPRLIMAAAAAVLGLEKQALVEQLQAGQSLAQVAESQGMSVDEFKAALLAQVESELDERVAAGDLTQEKADEMLAKLSERLDEIVNREGPPPFGGHGGPHRPFEGGPEASPEGSPEA